MPIRPAFRLVALVPVACAAALLAGCGSSAGGSTNVGSGSPTGTGGSSSPGGSGSSGSSVLDGIGHPVSVCTLLPATTVASVSGESITVATEDDTASYKLWSCNYTSADGTAVVVVNVLAMDAAAGFQGDVRTDSGIAAAKYMPISGLGDKAYSSIKGVEALFGNVSINVAGLAADSAAETLIRDLQPKL